MKRWIALNRNEFDIKLINTRRTEPEMLAYLLKHDSVYRTFSQEVCAEGSNLLINGSPIATSMEANPEAIDWEKHGVEVVVDATGAFTQREDLSKHFGATVKRVILTAPSKDESIPHLVLGVNDEAINWEKEMIISNASCTTNCASPMLKVLVKNFGIASGMLTTIHAMTMTQSMLDDANKKPDRSRSAIANIVPSTSGAAKAIVKTLPELEGKLAVGAVRVPVPTGSLTDLTINLETTATAEEVNMAFKQAASTNLKGILAYENEILVSSDFIGSPYSCIFDANYTKVINNTLLKVMGWYDNEWGYSTRLVDLIARLNSR